MLKTQCLVDLCTVYMSPAWPTFNQNNVVFENQASVISHWSHLQYIEKLFYWTFLGVGGSWKYLLFFFEKEINEFFCHLILWFFFFCQKKVWFLWKKGCSYISLWLTKSAEITKISALYLPPHYHITCKIVHSMTLQLV